ncbi:MAG: tripartite tricarboxylate transporter permease [Cypionkella sp.]|uniref:tripartite tricarboxylate transporter permease n=1 Tax=Cypionkella sp. TaxID=2811411 RepID=UPI002633F4DB|nr:tripartite tricarboxylate transporter permease [Cypionkella sp.]MDB5657986.1 tripartite tricarboxylate transporter permease [Cypionkella sp.]
MAITAVLGNSVLRGVLALFIGSWLGLVGLDSQTGQMRLTFGAVSLLDGIDVILVTVGLFAVGETMFMACRHFSGVNKILPIEGSLWMNRQDWARSWKPWLRGSLIMLSAFQSYGLNPGPLLFQSSPDLVWGLIASLYIGNVMLLALNLPMIGVWVRVLKLPTHYLYPAILVFALVGTYGISQSLADVAMLLALGVMGLVMRLFDFPTAPVVIGMILGPMAEQSFRRALTLSHGDFSTFLTQPLSGALLALSAVLLIVPMAMHLRAKGHALRTTNKG